MKSDEALAAEQSLEAKFAEAGLDQVRRGPSFSEAPEGTPAETVQDEQPRNELGQFAAVDEPETNEVAEPEAVEEEVVSEDPAVAAYLQKYGGDVNKAIAAAVHAQRQLGKQSTEVGQLRSENEQYQLLINELQGLRSDMNQARAQQPLDQATVDWFDQQVMENPYQAAEQARQQGNNMLLQRALSTWKEIDPYAASVYTNNLQYQEHMRQVDEKISKAQQLPMDATLNMALTSVQARNPHFANYGDVIESTIAKYPSAANAVNLAAQKGDRVELEQAIETLYGLAIGDTLQQQALVGETPANTSSTADVVEQTVNEPHEPAPAPTPVDEFRAAFKEQADARRRGVFVAE